MLLRKTKNDGLYANNIIGKNFFATLVQSVFYVIGFPKGQKNYLNLTIESGSKQRFSLSKEKSENFNSLRPILFKLCKKTTRGGEGSNGPPSPQE